MDQDTFTITMIISGIISLLILYFIFKAAVRSGNSEVERLLSILINLKAEEMKKEGFTSEEINAIINRVK